MFQSSDIPFSDSPQQTRIKSKTLNGAKSVKCSCIQTCINKYVLIKRLIGAYRLNANYENLLFNAFTYGKDLRGIKSLEDLKKYEEFFQNRENDSRYTAKRRGFLQSNSKSNSRLSLVKNKSSKKSPSRYDRTDIFKAGSINIESPKYSRDKRESTLPEVPIFNLNLSKSPLIKNSKDLKSRSSKISKHLRLGRKHRKMKLGGFKNQFINKVNKSIEVSRNSALKSRNKTISVAEKLNRSQEIKPRSCYEVGHREQQKYLKFIDKVNQVYNYKRTPLLMSQKSQNLNKNHRAESRIDVNNSQPNWPNLRPLKKESHPYIWNNKSTEDKSYFKAKLSQVHNAPMSRYLEKHIKDMNEKKGLLTLDSPELAELQYRQEKEINSNLKHIWKNSDLKKLRNRHRKILKDFQKSRTKHL